MTKILVANWKMNKGGKDGLDLLHQISRHRHVFDCLVVCPPFTLLTQASHLLQKSSVLIGAQDCSSFSDGAHTGDISAHMIASCGGSYVLIGHSERRSHHHETTRLLHQKYQQAYNAGLTPILCVGEPKPDLTLQEIYSHLETDLEGFCFSKNCFIAYEPIWAIGSGKSPAPETVHHIHRFIKETVYAACQTTPKVLYGGSVSEKNIEDFAKLHTVDGFLVGKASLTLESLLSLSSSLTSLKNDCI